MACAVWADIAECDGAMRDNFGVFSGALTTSIDGSDEFAVKFRALESGKSGERGRRPRVVPEPAEPVCDQNDDRLPPARGSGSNAA